MEKVLIKLLSDVKEYIGVDYLEGDEKLKHFTLRNLYTVQWESEFQRINSIPNMEQ
jgi:hypothetical protein